MVKNKNKKILPQKITATCGHSFLKISWSPASFSFAPVLLCISQTWCIFPASLPHQPKYSSYCCIGLGHIRSSHYPLESPSNFLCICFAQVSVSPSCWPWLSLALNYHKGFILTTFCLPICPQSSHVCQETQLLSITGAELWPGKGCFNFSLFLLFLHAFPQSGLLVCSPTPLCSKLMFSAC